jgi:murein DD-endopeptidase MepM/ murein hydrolase activator NlpD
MSVPTADRFPNPAGVARQSSNNFAQRDRPNPPGGVYARGKHGGTDIKPRRVGVDGDPLYPMWEGIVVSIGVAGGSGCWGPSYGNRVLIKHSKRHSHGSGRHKYWHTHVWYSFHAHLQHAPRVKPNQRVGIKTQLGNMGHTGTSGNTHCHTETHLKPGWTDGLVDPFPIVERRRLIEAA